MTSPSLPDGEMLAKKLEDVLDGLSTISSATASGRPWQADFADAAAAFIRSQASTIEALKAERDAALPHQGRKGDEWSTEGYWDATIGELSPDKTWHPLVWNKHRALHFTSVRTALAIAMQRAPECADVIATLIWSRELDDERTRLLLDAAESALATSRAEVERLTKQCSTPSHWALRSETGMHLGLWADETEARTIAERLEGCVITPFLQIAG